MTDTMHTGWPDAERPGIPLNPSRAGPHWIDNQVHIWVGHAWTTLALKDAAQRTYAGPVLPLAVLATLRATAERVPGLEAEVARLREALKAARAFVRAEMEVRQDSYTLGDRIMPDDEDAIAVVEEAETCFAAIETALARPADGVGP